MQAEDAAAKTAALGSNTDMADSLKAAQAMFEDQKAEKEKAAAAAAAAKEATKKELTKQSSWLGSIPSTNSTA